VREHAPEWAKRWEMAGRAASARALTQRLERLDAWRRDRTLGAAQAPRADRITVWLARESERLRGLRDNIDGAGSSPLLVVHMLPTEMTRVDRHPRSADGLLRQAWLAGLRDPEGLGAAAVRRELEGRGLDLTRRTDPSIDSLLPPHAEPEASWLTRRAATEVLHDPGLKFVRYQGLMVPDTGAPAAQPLSAFQALPALGPLLGGDAPADPLPGTLHQLAAKGRCGAMVTRLDIAPDFSMVSVDITLWVRQGTDRWQPAGSRVVRVRPEQLGPDAGRELADDPQVTQAFRLIEALGLQEISPQVKQRALAIGAATQRALGQARTAAQSDLNSLALPVLDRRVGPDRAAPDGGKP
jgi:hypothetical protein